MFGLKKSTLKISPIHSIDVTVSEHSQPDDDHVVSTAFT